MYYFIKLLLLGTIIIITGCGGSNSSNNTSNEQDNIGSNVTEESSLEEVPLELVFEPGVVEVDDPEPLVFNETSEFWMNGSPLSTSYPEYYSGFWRGALCGGSGFSRIGINGTSIELNIGAGFIDPMFGTVTSSGELLLPSREVNWNCESCGEVKPLTTTGIINWGLSSGVLAFEVACSSGNGHEVSTVNIQLKSGKNQPHPSNELHRILDDARTLIGSSPSCSEDQHCKLLSFKSDDFCNFDALAYSVLDTNEESLVSLQDEYRMNEWLVYGSRGSSLTLCAEVRQASCEQSKCI